MMTSPPGLRSWPARGIAGVALCLLIGVAVADTAGKSTTPASAPAAAAAPARKVICLQNSSCFSAKAPVRGTKTSTPTAATSLDLQAPQISRVFSEAELSQKIEEPDEREVIQETVQVATKRQLSPVSVGLLAIPWAIIHPTQAWRIFMPLPEAK